MNIQLETNTLTTKSGFALRRLIWECPGEKHSATHMDRMREEAVHHYAMMPPVLPPCLHLEREASIQKVQDGRVFQVQMWKTWAVPLKLQGSSNEYQDVDSRTGPKARWCAHTTDCMMQLCHASVLPRLFARPDRLHEIIKHESWMRYTSQIHTSNTEAAISYAVSPQLFRTRGSAACLDNKYITTGRCPFEAAFTMRRVTKNNRNKKGGDLLRGVHPPLLRRSTPRTLSTSFAALPLSQSHRTTSRYPWKRGEEYPENRLKGRSPLSKRYGVRSIHLHRVREHPLCSPTNTG